MTAKSDTEGKIVRHRWDEVRAISKERLNALEARRDEDIDYSDIPELPGGDRLFRDANGKLVKRKNFIREAVIEAMAAQEMTNYALWKAAKERCPTITESAIGQFVKGQRSIGIEYLEAIMLVLGLGIVKRANGQAPESSGKTLQEG